VKQFTPGKAIRRLVPLRACVGKNWPDREWVMEFSASGVRVWPKGHKSQAHHLSHRFIIGSALIFATRENQPHVEKGKIV
jgi:hypothetical protein